MTEIASLKGQLIVSCQALADEPLHSSFIMARMALAAAQGGAAGIRANTVADIKAIRELVALPVIGIIKREYADSEVYITPTYAEVDELVAAQCEIIALDATDRPRPSGLSLAEFFAELRQKYPQQVFMADCSTLAEMQTAEQLGFDILASTLVGYTAASKGQDIAADDFALLRRALASCQQPLIAEGNINSPAKAKRVIELGCFSVVVGSSITRPQLITQSYTRKIAEVQPREF